MISMVPGLSTPSDKYVQDLADESEDAKDLGIKASLDTVPLPLRLRPPCALMSRLSFIL